MPVGIRTPGYAAIKAWWVPAASITAFPVITAATLTSALEVSSYMLDDTKIGLGAPQTITESAVADVALTDTPTFATYSGSNLHLFRSFVAATGAVGSDDLLATFTGRPLGYYIRRVGLPVTTAAAAAQVVEAYLFRAAEPTIEAQVAGMIKLMVPLLQQGVFNLNIALT